MAQLYLKLKNVMEVLYYHGCTERLHYMNGSQRMIEVSKDESFYMQEYCGCVYSLRDTNTWREKNLRPTIEIGKKFYSHSEKDTTDN